ncbi:MAG: 23S rRNA (adenine(2503)-C(2))-methyltransferase RlmN [Verrucomicrobiae bacterium]|nr:23S rRNA (adenine(2503)-C(2))-methyltransferase RlmN [Verrucomicrobiae bacterium]
MNDLKNLTSDEIHGQISEWDLPAYRAGQILSWLFEKRVRDVEAMTNLPALLRDRLRASYSLHSLECVRKQGSKDTTQKFLWKLPDGQFIESVLIPANPALYGDASDRHTLCVSSQVGCAYGCRFCASGLEGWKRNLEPFEIVEQVIRSEQEGGHKVNNIVFMGMGEPLANYENLLRALSLLNAPWGLGIGARKMTLSTSGLVPRIRDLARQPLQVRLAISLHGATDEVRNRIMPVNKKHPLAELVQACRDYQHGKDRMITFEYILIEGVNDQIAHADDLGRLCEGLKVKVNLIPYNKVEGLPWVRPSEKVQEAFAARVRHHGVTATLRREKGHDIDAACGQLRLKELNVSGSPPAIE